MGRNKEKAGNNNTVYNYLLLIGGADHGDVVGFKRQGRSESSESSRKDILSITLQAQRSKNVVLKTKLLSNQPLEGVLYR